MSDTPSSPSTVQCADCNKPYGDPGFHDLVIPTYIWNQIAPRPDGGGVLCPTCIIGRLEARGFQDVPGAMMSGPLRTVDPYLMTALRQIENMQMQVEQNHEK